ncbi:MAG: hypothetical protein E7432_03530 [Ruminococcaceae bacterium]|nr:hypothetical protein [Oscillospiraceae bacterium]
MKKALLYFGCLAVIFAVLIGVTYMGKLPGKEISLYDAAMEYFEKVQEISRDEVTWKNIRYLPPEYHEKEYEYPFEQYDDMVKIEGKEDMLSEYAQLLEGVVIYDKEQEERVDYIDQWTEIEITGQYRRKIEENITKTEAAGIRIAVNHERNKVSIFAKGAKSGRNEVTYMLKTDSEQ